MRLMDATSVASPLDPFQYVEFRGRDQNLPAVIDDFLSNEVIARQPDGFPENSKSDWFFFRPIRNRGCFAKRGSRVLRSRRNPGVGNR